MAFPAPARRRWFASYLQARKLQGLWYRADSGDSDPAACCHYLQVAATRIAPQTASDLPALGPEQTADPKPFFRRFFAAFYAAIGSARILVIDNTQEALSSAAFRKLLLAAISEAPDHIGLIIVSRTRPPGEFARLLANGDLAVLGADELLLTEDESMAVQQLGAPTVRGRSAVQMRELHQVTGGWAAGLKLLLRLDNPDSPAAASGRVASDSGLFDYLAAEVFDRQSEDIRSFLLKVAHLPRMTPTTAWHPRRQRRGRADSRSDARDNLFTSLHDEGERCITSFIPCCASSCSLRARSELPGCRARPRHAPGRRVCSRKAATSTPRRRC
jgi:ATP/maltotriose-dependent transcriptional regulator MalT